MNSAPPFNAKLAPLLFALFLLQGCGGWGSRSDLSGARDEVVMSALAQIGAPYRYGGASPAQGFDCSGLVQYTHREAGISIPRSVRDQENAAKRVRSSRIKAGDLVFFNVGRGQHHVGIVVDDGRFVHSPSSSKQVQIARLDSPYWSKHLTGAGSFLN